MELRHLRSFVNVAETKLFSMAATRCCVTQSAVSQHIRALEDELGCKLLIRTSHGIVNAWDKYVAFNSMYADLCACMSEEEIIKAAYAFYFCDDDWQPCEDDCTKVWDYNALHATL